MNIKDDSHDAAEAAQTDHVYRKVAWRLVPFLMICYAVAYLDRVNVGYAKLGMSADLNLSDAVYGLGAGIFFLGYFLFEVPSNIMLHRLGARTWIARIMISWAVVSGACAFIDGPVSFYVLRFLLGVAEAGFFPGIILYLTYWFPAARRGRIIAVFMVAIPLAGLVGGPVSGVIMDRFDGLADWAGWRWMFVAEAVPALFLGLAVLRFLDSRPVDARWLSDQEQRQILDDLEQDRSAAPAGHARLRDLLRDPLLLKFSAIYLCCVMGQYGVTFWLPTMIADMAFDSVLIIGLVSAIPYGCAIVAMITLGWHSDKTGERRWHLMLAMLVGAFALAAAPLLTGGPILSMLILSIAAAAILAATPLFWNLPTATLNGAAAAVGIAAINSIGNIAGFLSPFMVGWINEATGTITAGMISLAMVLMAGVLLTAVTTRRISA